VGVFGRVVFSLTAPELDFGDGTRLPNLQGRGAWTACFRLTSGPAPQPRSERDARGLLPGALHREIA
jgi:hypothetical protein